MYVDMNFNGEAFYEAREEVSTAIRVTIARMLKQEVEQGSVTLKLDIALRRKDNKNIPGETDILPMIDYKVTSQVPVKRERGGCVNLNNVRVLYNGYDDSIDFIIGLDGQMSMDI